MLAEALCARAVAGTVKTMGNDEERFGEGVAKRLKFLGSGSECGEEGDEGYRELHIGGKVEVVARGCSD